MSESTPSLSLCLIVRDERATLPRCLESVSEVATQVVVVDTGSTDGTPALASSLGAEVFHFPWIGDFAAARNVSLERARGRWILVLDADEWLTAANAAKVAEIASREASEAFDLVQKSTTPTGEVLRNRMVRLFPNRTDVRFEHKIHEDVVGSLARAGIRILKAEIEIEHSGYADAAVLAAKSIRNRKILEALEAAGCPPEEEPHMRFNLARLFYEEGRIAEALVQFHWCVENSPQGSRISRMCQLRAAECLFQLGRAPEALVRLPSRPHLGEHPGSLMLVAKILHAENPDAARPWLECLLDVPDEAQEPPVALGKYKVGAIVALAKWWFDQGYPASAAALVAMAQEMKNGQLDPASPAVGARYRLVVAGNRGNGRRS